MDTHPIAQGKTKSIFPFSKNQSVVLIENRDDITAGDGTRRHDIFHGKASLATQTTCNMFEFLMNKDVPTAYIGRNNQTSFIAHQCTMIPVEVVMRRYAKGSYLKRNPDAQDGEMFQSPVIEFFLKTSRHQYEDIHILCDDPLMEYNTEEMSWSLFHPGKHSEFLIACPWSQERALKLYHTLAECKKIAQDAFRHIERVWSQFGGVLQDIKFEFGTRADGTVVLADVVDCDSWRVHWNGMQLSKQGYRDGDKEDAVLEVYRIAASITNHFVRL